MKGAERTIDPKELMSAIGRGEDVVVIDVRRAYGAANRALRAVADTTRVPLIDSPGALLRVPPAERQWGWAAHPTRAIYGEIARDVSERVFAMLPAS